LSEQIFRVDEWGRDNARDNNRTALCRVADTHRLSCNPKDANIIGLHRKSSGVA